MTQFDYFQYIIIYLVLVSVVAFIITVYDKISAIKGNRRVSENTLIVLSALGGSATMFVTMLIIRHKTKHIKFMLGIPIIILFQVCLLAYIYLKLK